MSSNPHAEQATSRLRNGTHNEVARAHVEATLALAYEQRTANLIGVYGLVSTAEELIPDPITTFLSERVDGIELAAQIKERLDLA